LPHLRHTTAASDPKALPRLELAGLSAKPEDPFGTALSDVALTLHSGEIVGIAGVSGNGQAELVSLLSGERMLAAADMILLDGEPAAHLDAALRRARGLGFVPEERLGRGAVPGMSLADNALLTAHRGGGLVKRGLVDRGAAAALARRIIERFDVRTTGPEAAAQSLSGGNLQKFIVGREISLKPHVLIVSQPTWGVDVAAAAFIRQTLIDLSRAGTAVLVISEELEELFQVCDRISVIHQGRLSPAKATSETSVEAIGLLMAGVGPAFQSAA
jgi:simple sugar transport system ATP-binding protein